MSLVWRIFVTRMTIPTREPCNHPRNVLPLSRDFFLLDSTIARQHRESNKESEGIGRLLVKLVSPLRQSLVLRVRNGKKRVNDEGKSVRRCRARNKKEKQSCKTAPLGEGSFECVRFHRQSRKKVRDSNVIRV